ncbi:dTDP-4-dehydrorhamnose reductase [Telmatospirillum sp.]|uniref:dTDP-4-dehydrorhamnose reductase n=1 Tax=Telmatospirillum sp. TaxID=2079197 RepID=UPI002842148D|nr:dTDP-4-dehydrorhamnose reductase [Telmatospirillum sp.]MDR3439722.1 dTDP-4-dehydrorhamnose reductase [Telmatospirillum sp.]
MTAPQRILVTGVSGQVGTSLLEVGGAAGMALVAAPRTVLDLAAPETLAAALDALFPDIVINCAAYTAVDRAEQEREQAFTINALAPERIAGWCAAHARPLIHLSTDYVFPGDGTRPYREDDPVGPLSVYGASKLEGERRVRDACPRHVILRTAWVYAVTGKNFVRTMLRLGADRDELAVVADQRGCPTAASSIAAALCRIAARLAADGDRAPFGTYHYVDRGETSWHGFAERIFDGAARFGRPRPRVRPITTADYPTPARRPAYSVLDTAKIEKTFGIVPPAWQDRLDETLADIVAADAAPSSPA